MAQGIRIPSKNGGIADRVKYGLGIQSDSSTTRRFNGQEDMTLRHEMVRFTVYATSWSSSANTSGYYTTSVDIESGFEINICEPPKIYLLGATASTEPTSAEITAYKCLKLADVSKISGSGGSGLDTYRLTLSASTKPTTTFYIFVDCSFIDAG